MWKRTEKLEASEEPTNNKKGITATWAGKMAQVLPTSQPQSNSLCPAEGLKLGESNAIS